MVHVLIVEDDAGLAAALDDALRFEGYGTSVAADGVEALRLLSSPGVDLVLLDRDLPVLSGDAVMSTIEEHRIPVAVLMLTAAAQVSDRVRGLDLGADDYLTKPFAYPELLARIRALTRRRGGGRDITGVLSSHGVSVDVNRHLVVRDVDHAIIDMSAKEFDVLVELMKADGGFVGRDELFRAVWDADDVADSPAIVKSTVYMLRRRLAGTAGIVSARGRGYRLS